MARKCCYNQRFEYSPLGSEFKKQTHIVKNSIKISQGLLIWLKKNGFSKLTDKDKKITDRDKTLVFRYDKKFSFNE